MPSPFPGMDPYIEGQNWADFHARLITQVGDQLVGAVRPNYRVDIERRLYVEKIHQESQAITPDLTVSKPAKTWVAQSGAAIEQAGAALAELEPVEVPVYLTEEFRESYIVIRELESRRVVTVIEVLSPANKTPGRKGYRRYLRKRNAVHDSDASLVEIDLLRGGQRLPMAAPLPPGDYYALVTRRGRGVAEVYAWNLERRLPAIPIPLAGDDPDVRLDLQENFTAVYDRAGYDYTLDDGREVIPLLPPAQREWTAEILKQATS